MHFLETINRNYTGFGVSDNELRIVSARRIGKRGIAIVWHNSISHNISIFDYRNFVDFLQSIISMYAENGIVIVMGDLNKVVHS